MDFLSVVWYAYNTLGSSSVHFPLESSNLFLIIDYGLVCCFSLSVALVVGWCWVPIGNPTFYAVSLESLASELESII